MASTHSCWRVDGSHVVQVCHGKLNAFRLQLHVHFTHFLQFRWPLESIRPCLNNDNRLDLPKTRARFTWGQTWMRLRTFSCTLWGGSYFGPMILTKSWRKSLLATCTWKRRPQFLTHVSNTFTEMKNIEQTDQVTGCKSTYGQCVHNNSIVFSCIGSQLLSNRSNSILRS